MKWLLRVVFVFIVAFALQYTPVSYSSEFCSVTYTVIGIMFSIALCLIMTFTFIEIPNDKFVERQKNRLTRIRNSYIALFAFATVALLLQSIKLKYEWKWIKIDIQFLIGSYLVFSLIYFIQNFISLTDLKNQIDDEIRKLKDYKKAK